VCVCVCDDICIRISLLLFQSFHVHENQSLYIIGAKVLDPSTFFLLPLISKSNTGKEPWRSFVVYLEGTLYSWICIPPSRERGRSDMMATC
jgi:hypothetical protein